MTHIIFIIFLFGISFFGLEILTFLCYANQESDDVVNCATKMLKYWMKNISKNTGAVFFKLGTRNEHHERNKMTPVVKKLSQTGKRHSSVFWKAFKISSNHFSFLGHFKCCLLQKTEQGVVEMSSYEPSDSSGRRLSPVSIAWIEGRLVVFLLPPGWDASPSQGYPTALNSPATMGEVRHCERTMSCPRTQHSRSRTH